MDAYINEDAEKSLIGLAMQDAIVAQEVAALSDSLFGLKQMQACQRGIMRLVKQGKNVDLVTLDAEVQCDFQDTALLMQCLQMGISPVMSRQYIAILAECAVKDQIWGIGLSMTDPKRLDPKQWRGQNLLGYALMVVRGRLKTTGKSYGD